MPRKPMPRCKHCGLPIEPCVGQSKPDWLHRHHKNLFIFCQLPTPKHGNPLRAEPEERK